jgi:hypothetical protein
VALAELRDLQSKIEARYAEAVTTPSTLSSLALGSDVHCRHGVCQGVQPVVDLAVVHFAPQRAHDPERERLVG